VSRHTRARLARLEARIPHAGEALIAATEAAEAFLSPALRARLEALTDLLERDPEEWQRLDDAASLLADQYAPGLAAWCDRMDAHIIPANAAWSSQVWRRILPKPPPVTAEMVRQAAADAAAVPEGEQRDVLIHCAVALGQALALARGGQARFVP
jgi:hypothetical protein